MQFDANRWYRVKVVAGGLDVSVATIYRAVESGALSAVRMGTGKGAVRVSGQAVLDYVAACERAAATSAAHGSVLVIEGRACVICGRHFRTDDEGRYFVGQAAGGAEVFACRTHQQPAVMRHAGGAA